MSHTTTPKGENQTNITFSDIANNPQGLTPLNDTAKLFNRHAETLRRWVRSDKNPFIFSKIATFWSLSKSNRQQHKGADHDSEYKQTQTHNQNSTSQKPPFSERGFNRA